MPKPTMIYQGGFSGDWYAVRAYKDLGEGRFVATGQKEVITEQMEKIIDWVSESVRSQIFNELIAEAESNHPDCLTPCSLDPDDDWQLTLADYLRHRKRDHIANPTDPEIGPGGRVAIDRGAA